MEQLNPTMKSSSLGPRVFGNGKEDGVNVCYAMGLAFCDLVTFYIRDYFITKGFTRAPYQARFTPFIPR